MSALLRVSGLVKHFRAGRETLKAVDGVDLTVGQDETHGLVGESGSGKTTTGRSILRLVEPTAGSVTFEDTDVLAADRRTLRDIRRRMQVVFQNPLGSLNPRMTVAASVAEPLHIHHVGKRSDRADAVAQSMESVGLDTSLRGRYPHQLSGGQRQRVAIARALATSPSLLICDEPVSALDVSIQSQILLLLRRLRDELGLSMLFISHDLAVVRLVADRISVMYLGKIVESGTRDEIFARPSHPYTIALLSAVPEPDPAVERGRQRMILSGDPPSPLHPPSGCVFRTRCPIAQPVCAVQTPELRSLTVDHHVACHFPAEGSHPGEGSGDPAHRSPRRS